MRLAPLFLFAGFLSLSLSPLPLQAWGQIPEVPPPTCIDNCGDSGGSSYGRPQESDYEREARQEWQREQRAKRQAARAEGRRKRKQNEAIASLIHDQNLHQEARRRAEAKQRQELERKVAAARRRQAAEERKQGFRTGIRTVQVPFPAAHEMHFETAPRLPAERPPERTLSRESLILLGTLGKSVKELPRKATETVMTYLAKKAGNSHAEEHMAILQINKGLADDATSQVSKALDLMRRNYPEPETSQFLASSSNRGLRVLVSSLSDVPEHAVVLGPEDETALEDQGRRFWGWLSGKPVRKDHPIPKKLRR